MIQILQFCSWSRPLTPKGAPRFEPHGVSRCFKNSDGFWVGNFSTLNFIHQKWNQAIFFHPKIFPPKMKPGNFFHPKIFPPKMKPGNFFHPKIFPPKMKPGNFFHPKIFPPKMKPGNFFHPKIFPPKMKPGNFFHPKIFLPKMKPGNFFHPKSFLPKMKPGNFFHPKIFLPKIKPGNSKNPKDFFQQNFPSIESPKNLKNRLWVPPTVQTSGGSCRFVGRLKWPPRILKGSVYWDDVGDSSWWFTKV